MAEASRCLPAALTATRAGELLGPSRCAAYWAAEAGELPVIRCDTRLRVPTPRLLSMLGADSRPDNEKRPFSMEAGPCEIAEAG